MRFKLSVPQISSILKFLSILKVPHRMTQFFTLKLLKNKIIFSTTDLSNYAEVSMRCGQAFIETLGIDDFTTDLYQRKFILFRDEDFKKVISFVGRGDGSYFVLGRFSGLFTNA